MAPNVAQARARQARLGQGTTRQWWRWLMPAAAVMLAQGANRGCGAGLGRSTVAGAAVEAVAQGGWAKPGLTDTMAQVGREKRNEVKVDGPSPSPFIKLASSRKASRQFRYYGEIFSQPAIKKMIYLGQIKTTQKENKIKYYF